MSQQFWAHARTRSTCLVRSARLLPLEFFESVLQGTSANGIVPFYFLQLTLQLLVLLNQALHCAPERRQRLSHRCRLAIFHDELFWIVVAVADHVAVSIMALETLV